MSISTQPIDKNKQTTFIYVPPRYRYLHHVGNVCAASKFAHTLSTIVHGVANTDIIGFHFSTELRETSSHSHRSQSMAITCRLFAEDIGFGLLPDLSIHGVRPVIVQN